MAVLRAREPLRLSGPEAYGGGGFAQIVITEPDTPTPFAFPIMVDRLSRDKLTSETLEDRVKKMIVKAG